MIRNSFLKISFENNKNNQSIKYFYNGSWPAFSDLDLFKKIILNDIDKDNHSNSLSNFYYFMTTNTHLPLNPKSDFICKYVIFNNDELCLYYELNISLISNILKNLENIENIIIIFFSDHPPNFIDNKLNILFNKDTIPYYVYK